MNVIETAIEGVVILEPRLFEDTRGYFFESFSQRDFEEKVGKVNFVQDNESKSFYGVLRQKPVHYSFFQSLVYLQFKFGFCFYLKVGMFSLVRCNLPYDKLQ